MWSLRNSSCYKNEDTVRALLFQPLNQCILAVHFHSVMKDNTSVSLVSVVVSVCVVCIGVGRLGEAEHGVKELKNDITYRDVYELSYLR